MAEGDILIFVLSMLSKAKTGNGHGVCDGLSTGAR